MLKRHISSWTEVTAHSPGYRRWDDAVSILDELSLVVVLRKYISNQTNLDAYLPGSIERLPEKRLSQLPNCHS